MSSATLPGLGDQRQVRGLDLVDPGAGAFGHAALRSRRDRPVLGPEEIPGRDRLPCRGGRLTTGRRERDRTLGDREYRGSLLREIAGQRLAEALRLDVDVDVGGPEGRISLELDRARHEAVVAGQVQDVLADVRD